MLILLLFIALQIWLFFLKQDRFLDYCTSAVLGPRGDLQLAVPRQRDCVNGSSFFLVAAIVAVDKFANGTSPDPTATCRRVYIHLGSSADIIAFGAADGDS